MSDIGVHLEDEMRDERGIVSEVACFQLQRATLKCRGAADVSRAPAPLPTACCSMEPA